MRSILERGKRHASYRPGSLVGGLSLELGACMIHSHDKKFKLNVRVQRGGND